MSDAAVTSSFRKGTTDGPTKYGYYTAGIDVVQADIFGLPDWHLHAMQFHSEHKAEAERHRDFVFDAIVAGGLMP